MANKVQLDAILNLIDVKINPKVFRKISQAVAGMPAALGKTNQHLKDADRRSKKLASSTKKVGDQLSQNERAARLFLRRMAQFAILLPTFATLNRAIQGSVKFLFEFDSALRDIIRIDIEGLSDKMEEVGDSALKTAADFGVTATEVLNVTRVFKQAGFDIEESQNKARTAILATQISTLNSAQAVEVFIAAQKQFVGEGENSISVLDKLAKVEDVAAVNAADVAEAFRTGGNALAEFSGSIDDSIGLIAALREQSRKSGREIGTFLKTIQTRMFAAGEARASIEALGVTVENLGGSLRPTLSVLNDLKARFDGLTQAQRTNAAKSIAGIRQFESLLAVLNSLERANELSAESSNAAGTAEEKRLITDAKLERQLGKLVAQGQALAEAFGDAGLEDTLKQSLGLATSLLKVFTSLVDTIGKLGGTLTPLLALAGVQLGRSVFGLASSGKPGGGGGSTTFIGGAGGRNRGGKASAFPTKMARGQAKFVGALNNSTVKLGLFTLAATVIPGIFNSLENNLKGLDSTGGEIAGTFAGISGKGVSLAAQFAFLGPQAAAIAGIFGTLFETGNRLSEAFKINAESRERLTEQENRKGKLKGAESRLLGTSDIAKQAQSEFFNNFVDQVKGADLGNDLGKGIRESLRLTTISDSFKDLELNATDLGESIFNNIDIIKLIIKTRKDDIEAMATSADRLDELVELEHGLIAGSISAGQAFGLLARAIGAGSDEFIDAASRIRDISFGDFVKGQKVAALADEIRTLGQELELATLGPDALADSVVRLQNELLLAERSSEQAIRALDDRLAKRIATFSTDPTSSIGLDPEGDSVIVFFNKVKRGVDTLNNVDIRAFEEFIQGLSGTEKKAAKEILSIVKNRVSAEIDIQKKRNALEKETSSRAQALLDAETQAANNAFASIQKFNAELDKFGKSVTTNVLAAFQNIQLLDVEEVLAGTSDLDKGIQDLIKNAFADPVTKAQNELRAVSSATEAELAILARQLDQVTEKLGDEANAASFSALTSEKRGIELAIETTKQKEAIQLTGAKIKVLESEREAAEKAVEAERKRQDLLEKLADASRSFDKELKDVQRTFEEFEQQKIASLLDQEASARGELKESQQEVLNTTTALSDAYDGLIKAQLEFNGVITEAKLKSNLLARDIGLLTGEISTFDGRLSNLTSAFSTAMNDANITLEKRIDLEQRLAQDTLSFLQRARDEIVQAGIGVFGQSGAENQQLGQGIQGLQFIADQLGGSFESFLSLTQGELSSVSDTLLGLPTEFRQQILNALSFLPSTTSIGGFSVDQLTQAIGQIGAGVSPEAGLPSIEELNGKQVEQLTKLQELALQDAQLQFSQVVAAQEQVAATEEALEAAKILEERAVENLMAVRDAVIEEKAVLDIANEQRRELMAAVIAADDKNTLMQIEREAQLFAEQNSTFREIGDNIVRGISSAIGSRLALIEASRSVANAANGFVPNFASGNLTPGEAASLLRAGSREKRMMPGGAGLAVANTKETIIPSRAGGFIPNFAEGSEIAAGVSAIKGINETVVAAIARSVSSALQDLEGDGGITAELLQEVIGQLNMLNSTSDDISTTNTTISANTTDADATSGTGTQQNNGVQRVEIALQTNQNNTITVSGLDNLRSELEAAVQETTAAQVDSQVEALFEQLDEILTALQERGILSSFGQTR